MKRGRDDGGSGPAHKRPASGPGRGSASHAAGLSQKLTTNDALGYLRDVKNKFQENKETYDTFLEIMKEFKAQRINTEGVIEKVKSLFKGHRELILGFNTFLPKGYEITMPEEDEPKQAVEFDQAINYVNKIKTRFSSDERVYKAFLEILNMYRKGHKSINNVYEEVAMLFRAHRDLLDEFTYFLPDSSPPQGGHPPNKATNRILHRPPPQRMGVGPIRPVNESNLIHRKLHQRKSARRADELIRRQQGAEEEDERRGGPKASFHKELAFFDKIRQKVRARDQYHEFLKCLGLFSQDIVGKQELTGMVQDIIGRYPDLMHEFNQFLARSESLDYEPDQQRLVQIGKLSKADLAKFKGEKYTTRPVSELDVTSWERCTTSYVRLPSNYPKLVCGGRAHVPPGLETLSALLNDTWVSVTSGSEDYSFKHMRKNQYEEHLFRCEDDRFELDMCIECNCSAIRALEPLQDTLVRMDPEDRPAYRIPDKALNAIQFRAIQRIYGESGHQIVLLMKQNPAVAIPVILGRLREKDDEWRRQKQTMAKMWQKVFDGNYHKSLDHRSFYFKQTDKKNLGTKAMIQEIKDVVDKRRAEENVLQAFTNPQKHAMLCIPDMSFDYKDESIHNDVFKVIKWGVEEICNAEACSKMLEFWVTFVEPFFGLPPRSADELKVSGAMAPGAPPAAAKPEDGRAEKPAAPKKKAFNLAGLTQDNEAAESEPASGGLDGDDSGDADGAGEAVSGQAAAPKPAKNAARHHDTPEGEADETEADDHALLTDAVDSDDGDDAEDVPVHPSADEELLEPTEEATSERTFMHCKPLAPSEAVRQAHTIEGAPTSAARVLYGNEAFYIFFRLHHYIYDRLRRAVKCSAEKVAQSKGKAVFPATGTEGEAENGPLPPLDPEGAKIHDNFMELVSNLIDGSLDSSLYEDHVRALLGTNSYVLFTLDKLIYKVVKQLQQLQSDELSAKLAELHRYEVARTSFLDAVYSANAHVLLGDENSFRFESRADGTLAVQAVEFDRSDPPQGVLDANFSVYLKQFTDSPPATAFPFDREAGRVRHPFLLRTLPPEASGPDVDGAAQEALEDSKIMNGLECKLSCTTSKVSYVLDTEDIFMHNRRPRQNGLRDAAVKNERFGDWVETRLEELNKEAGTDKMSTLTAVCDDM